MPQIESHYNQIEVLINDNASTDDTSESISNLIVSKGWKIDFQINEINLGAKGNIDKLVDRASGEYIYILGDDDIVSPNFIDIILPILEKRKYGIIHFNRLTGNADCSMNRVHDWQFNGLCEELTFSDFVKRVVSSPNFISSMIFRKESWDAGSEYNNDKRYYGYEFLARLYFGIDKDSMCLYYYMPLVIMRNPHRTWARMSFIYMMVGMFNIFADLDDRIPGIKDIWTHRARHTHFYDFYATLPQILYDRQLHRQYKADLMGICINKHERRLVKILLDWPCPKLIGFTYNKSLSLYRRFNHLASMYRITGF